MINKIKDFLGIPMSKEEHIDNKIITTLQYILDDELGGTEYIEVDEVERMMKCNTDCKGNMVLTYYVDCNDEINESILGEWLADETN